jgi:subtilase family serine protease
MLKRSTPRSHRVAFVTTALAVTAAALTSAAPAAGAATASTIPAGHRVTPAVGVQPHHVYAGKPDTTGNGQVLFSCQTRTTNFCYGPDQIRTAYGIQPLLDRGVTGKGRTIVIIDAYAPPNVQQELDTFTTTWGLPKADFKLLNPFGAGYDASDPNQAGWATEIALDVEWAHVVAPSAKILLVAAKTNNDIDIENALEYTVNHRLGDVVSQSYGEAERCVTPPSVTARQHAAYIRGTEKGMTFIAASGDQGSAQPTCDGNDFILSASNPATDPLVLAVGGTSLTADLTTGAYKSETVWNESLKYGSAGGGGFSTVFRKPWYQFGVVPGKYRGVPDVAYNAGIDGGVLTYIDVQSASLPVGWYRVGGTSAGSPQWAGLTALSAQLAHHSLGLLNDSIYAAARYRSVQNYLFHDITTGDNTYTVTDDNGNVVKTIAGFAAKPGWDAATGFGTPKANHLVPFLAAANGSHRTH